MGEKRVSLESDKNNPREQVAMSRKSNMRLNCRNVAQNTIRLTGFALDRGFD